MALALGGDRLGQRPQTELGDVVDRLVLGADVAWIEAMWPITPRRPCSCACGGS